MDSKISRGCLRGQPFGGIAVLIRDTIATNVTLVTSASRYIILNLNGILLINVYLPCSSCDNWEDEYADCLASIIDDISNLHFTHIISMLSRVRDVTRDHQGTLRKCWTLASFRIVLKWIRSRAIWFSIFNCVRFARRRSGIHYRRSASLITAISFDVLFWCKRGLVAIDE